MILSRSFLFLRLDRIRQKMAGAVGLELTTCGFGDRCSSQLSYTPACSGLFTQQPGLRQATLLGLLVHSMLALKLAVFLLLDTTGSISLLLRRRVIPALALSAFQCNNFTHLDSPCGALPDSRC